MQNSRSRSFARITRSRAMDKVLRIKSSEVGSVNVFACARDQAIKSVLTPLAFMGTGAIFGNTPTCRDGSTPSMALLGLYLPTVCAMRCLGPQRSNKQS